MAGGRGWVASIAVRASSRWSLAFALILVISACGDDEAESGTSADTVADAGIEPNNDASGDPLVATDLVNLDGETVATGTLTGEPLVLNFWFSTCVPCRKELPDFAEVDAELAGAVRFVGVNPFQPSETEERFARDLGVEFELLYDPDGELVSGLGLSRFPVTLLVTAEGTVVDQTGALSADELRQLIRQHLL